MFTVEEITLLAFSSEVKRISTLTDLGLSDADLPLPAMHTSIPNKQRTKFLPPKVSVFRKPLPI